MEVEPGRPGSSRFGFHLCAGGAQFALFSRDAWLIHLLLFDSPTDDEPSRTVTLDPSRHRFGDVWSAFIPNIKAGQLYLVQAEGPSDPAKGYRFNSELYLLDPYTRGLTTNIRRSRYREQSRFRMKNKNRPKCIVIDDTDFDWQGVAPPRHHLADSVIYEVHVKGLTAHPSSQVARPGTYLGLLEKIPYLKSLGVTAVELLPIHEFDNLDYVRHNPLTNELLCNYWGYNPHSYFCPHSLYAWGNRVGDPVREFKTMVRELHRNGIEVILDVVYNHTAEGNHLGPTINFRGIDNRIYYHLAGHRDHYKDFSGCGNSLNANHPAVAQMILDSLRYWVEHMHVDGFRFDLASVLSRDRHGHLSASPFVLEAIAEDPVLRDTKIIAEAWDAAGAYQVGSFPGGRWAEWNGKYRDDVRQFWRGDPGKTGAFATRLTGSSDLYEPSGRNPYHSINFITSHDGFTLNDLVSYNHKHNEANGEENRDGDNNNHSFNFGEEGPTSNPVIEQLRGRQVKNLIASLMLSQGVPMILGGDEFRRTQGGNNNAYCQDNEVSWFDWSFLKQYHEHFRFVRALVHFRRRHPVLRRTEFFEGVKSQGSPIADINWFQPDGRVKNWDYDDHTLMCLLDGAAHAGIVEEPDDDLLLLFNSGQTTVPFTLPDGGALDSPWCLFLDTGYPYPLDIFPEGDGPRLRPKTRYPLVQRSMACFYRARASSNSKKS